MGNDVPSFARITDVAANQVKVTGVATVTGICSGEIPTSDTVVSSLVLQTSPLERSTESKLYALMPKAFISDVDLTNSSLTIRKSFSVDVALNPNSGLGQLSSALSAGINESFLPFDEERYVS